MFSADDLVVLLSFLRETMELEAGTSCLEIEVDPATVLADVCEALYLSTSQTRQVLGDVAYDAIYGKPIAVILPDGDPWAELRAKVRAVYAESGNVTIFGQRQDQPAIEEVLAAVGV